MVVPYGVQVTNLPVMLPIRKAALAALQRDMDVALASVAQEMGYADPLDPIAFWSTAAFNQYSLIPAFPGICVVTGTYTVQQAFEQFGGFYQGELLLRIFLQNSNPDLLTDLLDYYAAAAWRVLTQAESDGRLAGSLLLTDSLDVQPDPSGSANGMARAVQVGVNVQF
jgi:hypothetical protein